VESSCEISKFFESISLRFRLQQIDAIPESNRLQLLQPADSADHARRQPKPTDDQSEAKAPQTRDTQAPTIGKWQLIRQDSW
jgi:hypothetical protein